jgi:hypothetical protein
LDSVETIALAVAGGVVLLAIVAVFVLPGLGGDRRHGGKEHDYAGNQPTAGGEGGD